MFHSFIFAPHLPNTLVRAGSVVDGMNATQRIAGAADCHQPTQFLLRATIHLTAARRSAASLPNAENVIYRGLRNTAR